MEEVGRGDQGCDNRNLSCGSTMLLLLLLLDLRILGASDVCILLDKPIQNLSCNVVDSNRCHNVRAKYSIMTSTTNTSTHMRNKCCAQLNSY